MANVSRINVVPVKGLAMLHPESVELTASGVVENRRFYLVSGGRLFNGKDHGPIVRIVPTISGDSLSLAFPGGEVVSGEVELGAAIETDMWGRPVAGHIVVGPWAEALSEYAGAAVTLVQTDAPGTGVDVQVGTVVGLASCERLSEELGSPVDPRRFRALFEIEGLTEHEEDTWEGQQFRIGEATVTMLGPVPRCAVTMQDPDTGLVTLDTLRGIKNYRDRKSNV